MRKTNDANIGDRQPYVDDILKHVDQANDALQNAESCETSDDFDANIDEATDALTTALRELKELRQ